MRALYTIGYTRKSLEEFIRRLKNAQVDCVVDIRLNNTSQLAGFAKRDDLHFLLEQGFQISYIHLPELAPTEEILTHYKQNRDWNIYQHHFQELIGTKDMVLCLLDTIQQNGWQKPCLLCSEDSAEKCHRRLLAEAVQAYIGQISVEHL